jgi:hypothetical protein
MVGSIYTVNPDWIEAANFHKGVINVIPLMPATAATYIQTSNQSAQGSAYLALFGGLTWVPALVLCTYTCGFPNGIVPVVINEIIGINAALDVLTSLAATYRMGSYSLSVDSMSQSVSTPGPQIYDARIKFLLEQKERTIKLLKNMYGLNFVSGYI